MLWQRSTFLNPRPTPPLPHFHDSTTRFVLDILDILDILDTQLGPRLIMPSRRRGGRAAGAPAPDASPAAGDATAMVPTQDALDLEAKAKKQLKVALELRRNLLRAGCEEMEQKERLLAARPREIFKAMGEQVGKITDSTVAKWFRILAMRPLTPLFFCRFRMLEPCSQLLA
jgi:hypothetical protein